MSFGPGLLIGTFFFGISHIFNSYSPFEGIFNLSWGGGFWTFAAGLFCGFLKEKTKNIIAPGIAHGYNAFGEALLFLLS